MAVSEAANSIIDPPRGLNGFMRQRRLRGGDDERYSNAHNAEAAVALYERAEYGLCYFHDFAPHMSELRSPMTAGCARPWHGSLNPFLLRSTSKRGHRESPLLGALGKAMIL
jgi:hypothetical protein